MTEKLTDSEINGLFEVGQNMCADMIKSAAFADDAESWGVYDPRVSTEVIDAWIAVVSEFDEAYTELAAGGALL